MKIFFSTLRRGTSVDTLAQGCFSGVCKREIILSRNNFIELFRQKKNGKIFSVGSFDVGSQILSLSVFFLNPPGLDFLLLLDITGKLTIIGLIDFKTFSIISYKNMKTIIKRKKSESLFSAINKKSLVCMVCAIERMKYGLVIKSESNLPIFLDYTLEIKHNSTICFHLISMEIENKNIFACIETSYDKPYDKFLVFYNINLGENSVNRKIFSQINTSSYQLIPFPEKLFSGGGVIICSLGFLTIAGYRDKIIKMNPIPRYKSNLQKGHSFITSYSFYEGKSRVLLILVTEEGHLFRKIFEIFPKNKDESFYKIDIKYFETLPGIPKSITILQNGYLFVNMEAGNHLYYHFSNFGEKADENQFFFRPNFCLRNLFLVDQFTSVAPVINSECSSFFTPGYNELILLCGSKTRSTVRVLQKSSGIDLIRKKKFKELPIGLNIIKNTPIFNFLVVSFKKKTCSFSLTRNIEEINSNGLISNHSTFSTEFLKPRNGVIQTTAEKLRFVQLLHLKRKITDWKPPENIFITNSTVLGTSEILIFLLLTCFRGTLIKIKKDGVFLEIKRMKLGIPTPYGVFGVPYKKNKKLGNLDFILFLCKKERTSRYFIINEDFSLSLSTVQLLPWSPETANILNKDEKLLLITSLNNGMVIQSQLNPKNARLESQKIFRVCRSPLFISNQKFSSRVLVFGPKIWKLEIFFKKKAKFYCLYDQPFNLAEPFGDYIIITHINDLKIIFGKKIHNRLACFCYLKLFFTPIDLCFVSVNSKLKAMIIVHSDNFSNLPIHQMDLSLILKQGDNNYNLTKNIEGNWVTGLLMFSIENFKKRTKKIGRKNLDSVLIRGANKNKYITSVYSKKSSQQKNQLILVGFKTQGKSANQTAPMILIRENVSLSVSIAVFFLKKETGFFPEQGGRGGANYKISFVFEKFFKALNCINPTYSLGKTLVGNRSVFYQETLVCIFEVKKKGFDVIARIKSPSFSLSKISSYGNRVFLFDYVEGVKIYLYSLRYKSFSLVEENIQLKFLNFGKMLDPFTMVLGDESGVIFFLRCLDKSENKTQRSQKPKCFSIMARFDLKTPIIKIFDLSNKNLSSYKSIYTIDSDGLIGKFEPIKEKNNNWFSGFRYSFTRNPNKLEEKFLIESKIETLSNNNNTMDKNFLRYLETKSLV